MKIFHLDKNIYPEELQNAWKFAYGKTFPYKYPERFNWLNSLNPYCNKTSTGVYYLMENEEVAAWSTVLKHEVRINHKVFKAGFGADTYTMPNFRRLGFGLKIIEKLIDESDVYWAIGMAPGNRRVRMKAGCVEGHSLNHYLKVIDSLDKTLFIQDIKDHPRIKNQIIRLILGSTIVSHLLFSFVNRILKTKVLTEVEYDFKFEKIEQFDHEVDAFWVEQSEKYDFTTNRDSTYLNWRYGEQPFVEYQKYKIYQNNRLIGFVVFRIGTGPQQTESYITELVVHDDFTYAMPQILNFVEVLVKGHETHTIYIASSLETINKQLEDCAYGYINNSKAVFKLKPYVEEQIDLNTILSNTSNWYMSLGDQDLDQFKIHKIQPGPFTLIRMSYNVIINKIKFWKSMKCLEGS